MTPVASYGSEPSESQKNCSDYLIVIDSNLIKKFFSISAKIKPRAPLAQSSNGSVYGCSWSFGSIENFLLSLLSGMFLCQERQETK